MIILNKEQIKQKIRRMAMEVYERHADEKELLIAGINNKGLSLASLLAKEIKEISPIDCQLVNVRINPANPIEQPARILVPDISLTGKSIVLVDDVSNSGRTMFYAMQVFMKELPNSLETAVLIERTHKKFPVEVRFVGTTLATTIQENIEVYLEKSQNWRVELS